MVVMVDTKTHCGNNDGMKTIRNPMPMSPQERHPHLTTSISGIDADEWKALHAMAQQEGVTNREALERAVRSLVADIKDGKEIVWRPSKVAPRKAVKIHADVLDDARKIGSQLDLRINVIISTAIHRWLNKL